MVESSLVMRVTAAGSSLYLKVVSKTVSDSAEYTSIRSMFAGSSDVACAMVMSLSPGLSVTSSDPAAQGRESVDVTCQQGVCHVQQTNLLYSQVLQAPVGVRS